MKENLVGSDVWARWRLLKDGSIWSLEEYWRDQRSDGSFDHGLRISSPDKNSINEDPFSPTKPNKISYKNDEVSPKISSTKETIYDLEEYKKDNEFTAIEHSSALAKDSSK